MTTQPWYKDGLRFKCTECGKCCTGGPGYVWITEQEMENIARLLNITTELFKRKYIRQVNNRFALVEKKSQNFDCIFLKDKKCMVYQARPKQCRTYPWWRENLNTPESWKIAAQTCEGINDEASIVPFEEIEKQLKIHES
jgi:Fe-S-cluster containining protein